MALFDTVKREASQLMVKLGLGDQNMMQANFRSYGEAMGLRDFDSFIAYARRIYREAQENPQGFTIINLPKSKKAIDFQGKIRGVYTQDGEPVAFFRPDYQQLGYRTLQEELREFKTAVLSAYS